MIEAKGITKFYGSFKALSDVSFRVDRGEVLGFLGPNGAGKSTTMKVLTTYLSASEGTAAVDGFDVHAQPIDVRKRLGYLPETPPLYGEMTVEDYLKFAGRARGLGGDDLRRQVAKVVADCGLAPKYKNAVNELSKGYRQRVGIAQALIHDPPALILDEPTSGLDPNQIIEIRKLISGLRDQNKAVIFSTHILQEAAAVAGRLVIINNGQKVADGTPDELATRVTDKATIKLLVRGAAGSLMDTLAALANVSAVEPLDAAEGYTRCLITVKGGSRVARESCEQVSRAASKLGLTICELSPETLSLEQVFLKLLNQGRESTPTPAAATPKDDGKLYSTSAGTRMVERGGEDDIYNDKPPTETSYPGAPVDELPEDEEPAAKQPKKEGA